MRFISLESTPSTNLEARELAETGDFGPLWIRADEQVAGRGRRGRDWTSPKGNLYCTGLYPHSGSPSEAALLSFVAALAVYDVAAAYVPQTLISLKWPNDVLLSGAKTSGILLENGRYKGQDWVAVGIGVNLVSHPQGTDFPATHILEHIPNKDLQGAEPIMTGADAALAILAARFDHWRNMFLERGFEPIRKAWRERAANVPGPVTVRLAQESFHGEAVDLGANGELQVRTEDGTLQDVHAGDVFFGPSGKTKHE